MRRAAVALVVALGSSACLAVTVAPRPPASARLTPDAAARAFVQGIEAAELGQPIGACPFAGDEARRAWRAGWSWARGR